MKHAKPWGYYVDYVREPNLVIKQIVIFPGECISLQYHLRRKEEWIIHQGEFMLELDSKVTNGKSPYRFKIDECVSHRILNVGTKDLVIYEIQTGECDENDIVRLEDKYGRETL